MWLCTSECWWPGGQRMTLNHQELKIQEAVNYPRWVLGIELRCDARAVSTPNHWAVGPTSLSISLLKMQKSIYKSLEEYVCLVLILSIFCEKSYLHSSGDCMLTSSWLLCRQWKYWWQSCHCRSANKVTSSRKLCQTAVEKNIHTLRRTCLIMFNCPVSSFRPIWLVQMLSMCYFFLY